MAYKSIKRLNKQLAQNPELSEHNKKVLNEFFSNLRSSSDSNSYKRTLTCRFNVLAEHIDFDLDNPDKSDIQMIVGDLNEDVIRRKDGQPYSVWSKESLYNTLSKFYTQFIKEEGKGHNPDVDGPALFEGVELRESTEVDIDRDAIATPEQVKKVAEEGKNLTHQAVVLFGWSTGFRICEWLRTPEYPEPIKWKDITFKEKDMKVEGTDGKTGDREVWVRTAKPILKKLKEQEDPDPEDPVFTYQDARMMCPECDTELEKINRASYHKRRYKCPDCDWTGKTSSTEKHYKPLTGSAVRKILKRCYERSEVGEQVSATPHDFFRKSRAIYWAVEGKNESWLREFFGWSDKTNTPRHYIKIVSDDLRRGIHDTYEEDYDEDFYFDVDTLKPIICSSCHAQNSPLWDLCRRCDQEITYDGLVMKKENPDSITNRIKHETKDEIINYLKEKSDVEDSEIENVMVERLNQKMEEQELVG